MSKKEKKVPQRKYRVTITKSFEYPSCVIDSNNKKQDIFQKAGADFLEFIARAHIHLDDFSLNLESDLPFRIRNAKESDDIESSRQNTASMEHYLREFCIADVEAKYGRLDPISNPSIYVQEEKFIIERDEDDDYNEDDEGRHDDEPQSRDESNYYLTNEVARYWDARYDHYYKIIRNRVRI